MKSLLLAGVAYGFAYMRTGGWAVGQRYVAGVIGREAISNIFFGFLDSRLAR